MAKDISKKQDLHENVINARYLLEQAKLKSNSEWLIARTKEQRDIVDKAVKRIDELKQIHEAAKLEIPQLERELEVKERAFTDYVNRGDINKLEDAETKLVALITQLKATGKSDEEIRSLMEAQL